MMKEKLQAIFLDFLARISSRTFLVAVILIALFVAMKQYGEAVAVAIAYISGEKVVDATSTLRNKKLTFTEAAAAKPAEDNNAPDRSEVYTGSGLRIREPTEERQD